ncbi:winged helix-turn-helix transcriptional regulator [Pseudoalteromonas denitrificans]|uniref:Transcriptional regulator, HxlR family n=1 Tax=Pseudoalteromonas denitrificans DSM 6059 TaxID=1123010 RepID=A0A1I1TNH9_9GAMM|nr:helix-turn-helix domain-containing protein [Pseudoalteromonas denitrificans]SFD60286.1 transcriptional regulator, HxlR family [Pseudoalteromonas denitrificans DSM 6059]
MTHNSENFRSNCPINFVLETFGDKWTLLIVRDLMFKSKQYYGEFLKSNEKISTNILADRLQKLESSGVIKKAMDTQNKSKVLYSLTDKGKDLLPIMLEITSWSHKYDDKTNVPENFIKALSTNRASVISQTLSKLK